MTNFKDMTTALCAVNAQFGSLGNTMIAKDEYGCNIMTCFFENLEVKVKLTEVLNGAGNVKHIEARQVTKNEGGSYSIIEPLELHAVDCSE